MRGLIPGANPAGQPAWHPQPTVVATLPRTGPAATANVTEWSNVTERSNGTAWRIGARWQPWPMRQHHLERALAIKMAVSRGLAVGRRRVRRHKRKRHTRHGQEWRLPVLMGRQKSSGRDQDIHQLHANPSGNARDSLIESSAISHGCGNGTAAATKQLLPQNSYCHKTAAATQRLLRGKAATTQRLLQRNGCHDATALS